VPLQGEELEAFLEKERASQEKTAAQAAQRAQHAQAMLEADADDSDTDSDEEDEEDEVERALGGDMLDLADGLSAPAAGEPGGGAVSRKKSRTGAGIENDWGMDGDEGLSRAMLSFDIYLKGNVSRATSFFKAADGQQRERFRMFPYVERKRRVDEYGETVDVGMWLRKGKVLEEAEKEGTEVVRQAEEETKVRVKFLLTRDRH
jgi:cleavage and polyadenylation specificity factor subunit 2